MIITILAPDNHGPWEGGIFMGIWRKMFDLKEVSELDRLKKMIRKSKSRYAIWEIIRKITDQEFLTDIACSKNAEIGRNYDLAGYAAFEAEKKVTDQDFLKRIAEQSEGGKYGAVNKITDRGFLAKLYNNSWDRPLREVIDTRLRILNMIEEQKDRIAKSPSYNMDYNSVDSMARVLQNKMADLKIRRSASAGLGVLGDVQGVTPLLETLENLIHDREDLKDWEKDVFGKALILALAKIGDIRACAPIINAMLTNIFLFKPSSAPIRREGDKNIVDQYPWREHINSLQQLFGDYAELIAGLMGYREIVVYMKVTDEYWRQMKLHEQASDAEIISKGSETISSDEKAKEALKKLVEIKTPIANNLLYDINHKMPTSINYLLQPIISMELGQRGNPPYDLEAYLDKDAWLLPTGEKKD
jgi:hypothetical protein